MEIRTNLTLVNRTTTKGRDIDFIVIHYVGAISSAKANSDYFKWRKRNASAHYFVDDNYVYQVVREKDIAWHCGTTYYKHLTCRNSNSIGIEMCCYNNNGILDISKATEDRTIKLVKELMKKYNIPITNVLRHYDITGKNCPAPMVKDYTRWIKFIERLKEEKKGKYNAGDIVEINIPIGITGAEEGDNILVDDNRNQFWVNKSVIRNNRIIARATICYAQGTNYIVQVFDKQFWVREEHIAKKLD